MSRLCPATGSAMKSSPLFSEISQLGTQLNLLTRELAACVAFSAHTVYRWDTGDSPPRVSVLHCHRSCVHRARSRWWTSPTFRFEDLFAGIGRIRHAIELLADKCVYTSQRNRFAQPIFLSGHDCDHEIGGDITQVNAHDLPNRDIVYTDVPP